MIDVHEEPASVAGFEVRAPRGRAPAPAPIVYYSAQNIEKRYPPPFRWMERSALAHAGGVHCANAEAARIMTRKGLRGIARVIGLGVDVERFAPAATERPDGTFRLGYVGRLEPHKGVGVLLDAIATAIDGGCASTSTATGPSEPRSRRKAKRLGDRVAFHGFAIHDALPDVFRSFDALAVPSLRTPRWVEQFGRVAVEAMASGLPVLASADGSLPEVVGDAGVLVPPGDVRAWREALALAGHRLRHAAAS